MFRKALANDPEFLLMDEPFGASDAQTRLIMQEILLKVWEDTGKTILFVTHDVNVAVFLVDKVYVMTAHPGKLKYIQDVDFERPRHPDINTLLKSYPLFVYRVDEHYSEMTDVYIKKNQLHPSKIVEFGSLPAIKKAVLNGICVGIISSPVIRQELDQNILFSLVSRAEPVHVFSSLIILKSKTEWPNAQEFIEFLPDTWDSATTY